MEPRLLLPVALLGFLLLPCGLAADPVVWTVPDAVEASVRSNAGLKQKQLSVTETQEQLSNAWNLFLPSIDVQASLARAFDGRVSPWSGTLSASATLALSPGLSLRISQLSSSYRASLASYESARLDLERMVRETCYAILLNGRRTKIAQGNLDLARNQYLQVQEQFRSGRASELDLLSARLSYMRRQPEVETLLQTLDLLYVKLREVSGLAPDAEVRVEGTITVPARTFDRESLVRSALDTSTDLQALEIELIARRQQKQLFRDNNKLPLLSMSFRYAPSVSPPLASEPWSDPSTWKTGSLSLSLTVPIDSLLPGSSADMEVRAAEFDVARAQIALEDRRRTIRSSVESLVRRLDLSAGKLEILRAAEEIARQRYQRTVDAYRSGGTQLLDVENAQNDMQQSQLDVVNETYNYQLLLTELERLCGQKMVSE